MRQLQVELCIYQDGKGRQPFADWFDMYFAGMGIGRFLILGGGSKRSQAADIERARKWLEDARKQHGR